MQYEKENDQGDSVISEYVGISILSLGPARRSVSRTEAPASQWGPVPERIPENRPENRQPPTSRFSKARNNSLDSCVPSPTTR